MITIIAAIGKNNELGKDNQLLWHLPEDLKYFKKMTLEHPIIMGRKTYESIGKPLPNRTNIVVSRKEDWFEEGILIVPSIKDAIKHAKKINEQIFIIGGGNIYEQTIDFQTEADAFFPKIDENIWQKTDEIHHPKDEKHTYDFSFQTWERRK